MTLAMDRTLPDYRLDEIRLDPANKTAVNVQIGELLTDGNLTLSIIEASTLVLSVDDPDKALLNSDLLVRWVYGRNADRGEAHWIKRGEKVDLTLDDLRFRLKRLEKSPERVLTLESREWAVERLRQFRGAKHATRAQDGQPGVTRAQFVRSLADEAGVPWHIPELGDPQPTRHAPELTQQQRKQERNKRAAPGIGPASKLTVKGVKARPEQLENASTILDEAAKLRAPERVMVAAITCATNESNLTNVRHGDAAGPDSTGLFQQRASWGPRSVRQDPAGAARLFLKAAIKIARRYPKATIPELVAMVQFPGVTSPAATHSFAGGIVVTWNARWVRESRAIVAAYGGATTKGGGVEIVVEKAFTFQRGAKENSWDAIKRLAEEVSWRAFVRKGVLWYISDEALRKQEPALVARETEPGEDPNGIESIAIPSLDLGARDVTANITVTAAVGRTAVLPGMVVRTENEGPADDVPWLVESVERPLWDDVATINCVRPTGKKDEPAADTKSVTFGGTTASGEGTGEGEWTYGPGVPHTLNRGMRSFMNRMATFMNRTIVVTTTTNHSYLTSNGTVSDHNGGGAADIGSVANHFGIGDARGGGYEIAVAAHRACGSSEKTARKRAGVPNYTRWKCPEGSVQILWMVAEHEDHVHVGLGGGAVVPQVPLI